MRGECIHQNGNENVPSDAGHSRAHKVYQTRNERYRAETHLLHSSPATEYEPFEYLGAAEIVHWRYWHFAAC